MKKLLSCELVPTPFGQSACEVHFSLPWATQSAGSFGQIFRKAGEHVTSGPNNSGHPATAEQEMQRFAVVLRSGFRSVVQKVDAGQLPIVVQPLHCPGSDGHWRRKASSQQSSFASGRWLLVGRPQTEGDVGYGSGVDRSPSHRSQYARVFGSQSSLSPWLQ